RVRAAQPGGVGARSGLDRPGASVPEPNARAGGPARALLWLLLIWYAVRLLIRLAYSLFRLLGALLFGPAALILWAIPQTEWVTGFWVRELIGWATTPLLVTACLALAIPLANGRDGFLAAAVFGIAGLQAAYDLVGVLSSSYSGGNRSLAPFSNVHAAAEMAS